MQVKKIQADRDLLFQENEDQARELSLSLSNCHMPLIYTLTLCVCVCVCVCVFADINLGHEPELQNGWTRLQEEVSSTSLCWLPRNIGWTVDILRECM